jgi:hypothetical protein
MHIKTLISRVAEIVPQTHRPALFVLEITQQLLELDCESCSFESSIGDIILGTTMWALVPSLCAWGGSTAAAMAGSRFFFGGDAERGAMWGEGKSAAGERGERAMAEEARGGGGSRRQSARVLHRSERTEQQIEGS